MVLGASRTARGAAKGAAALGVVAGGTAGLLMGEARLARRKVERHTPVDDPPTGNGMWGVEDTDGAEPIVLAVLGDSSAVGLGVDTVAETPGVLLATGLSRLSHRPVRLVRVAVSGSESKDLEAQVTDVLPQKPTIAVIMIGANDVTARTRVPVSVSFLGEAVRRLREAGAEVVVGTCPDLGTVRPIPQPLRLLARRWSRQMSAAQVVAVVDAGGRSVSLGDILGPTFAKHREMWSRDGFHPSADGYAAAATVLLPAVADAMGVWPIRRPKLRSHTGRRPIEQTAARAAQRPGSEVTPTDARLVQHRRNPLLALRRVLRLGRTAESSGDTQPQEVTAAEAATARAAVDAGTTR